MDVRSSVLVASSSEALIQQHRERAVDVLMFQVLDNPSLREEILTHVIFGKVAVDRKAACTLRLVDKSWNDSVLRILRKAHEPLFRLDAATEDEVEDFVSTFAASADLLGSVPPLAVHDCWCPENLESCSNCLTRCGDGLIQLGLTATEDGRWFDEGRRWMEAGLQHWALPRLHRLDITLFLDFPESGSRSDGQGEVAVEDDDKFSTSLLKSVLRTATSLSVLGLNIIGTCPVPPKRPQFTVFDSVILPPSLIKITVCITASTQHLEMLAKSPLPNLTYLSMHVGSGREERLWDSGPFSDGLIIRILENCRKSLKTVRLSRNDYQRQPTSANIVPSIVQQK